MSKRPSEPGSAATVTTYCGHCGAVAESGEHQACEGRSALEPPRFCVSCRRRMKVQVTPVGWSAVCVQHGRSQG